MAAAGLTAYLASVAAAVDRQDGAALASALRIDNARARDAVAEGLRTNSRLNVAALCESRLPPPFDEALAAHCLCLAALQQSRTADAYDHLSTETQAFIRCFRDAEGDWCNAALQALALALRVVAQRADAEAAAAGRAGDKLTDAGGRLSSCFSATIQERGNVPKKMAALAVVNQMFKVYFRLNTLHLCKNVIKAVEAPTFPPFESFPPAHRVTYAFYRGRLAVFDDDYTTAESQLAYASRHCPKTAAANRRRVMTYLVPVRLLLGRLPRPQLLSAHGLGWYDGLSSAVRRGNVALLDATLQAHQERLIQAGTYLLLEKLRPAVTRTLLKRVAALHAAAEPGRANQLPLALLQRALSWLGSAGRGEGEGEMDLDHTECLVANLIHRRYVKGYISHKSRVLVLSKQDPFPPLTGVALRDV